jgi:hypothetical protein
MLHGPAPQVGAYCEAYARHLLVTSIGRQFEAFNRGFLRLCSGAALAMFRCVCVLVGTLAVLAASEQISTLLTHPLCSHTRHTRTPARQAR